MQCVSPSFLFLQTTYYLFFVLLFIVPGQHPKGVEFELNVA